MDFVRDPIFFLWLLCLESDLSESIETLWIRCSVFFFDSPCRCAGDRNTSFLTAETQEQNLGGGFKHSLVLPLPREMIEFDYMDWFNHQKLLNLYQQSPVNTIHPYPYAHPNEASSPMKLQVGQRVIFTPARGFLVSRMRANNSYERSEDYGGISFW